MHGFEVAARGAIPWLTIIRGREAPDLPGEVLGKPEGKRGQWLKILIKLDP